MVIDANRNRVFFSDGSHLDVENIIWATGYKSSIPWLEIDGVFDDLGRIVHHRGVTNIEGLFFIGLPWQYRRGSAIIQGVGADAKYIDDRVMVDR